MDVEIINFPVTKVAVIEHQGSPESEHESVKKLIAWRIENKLPLSDAHRSYGIHYNDPRKVAASDYRVDLCISVEQEVAANSFGVLNKSIPALRCAKVRSSTGSGLEQHGVMSSTGSGLAILQNKVILSQWLVL